MNNPKLLKKSANFSLIVLITIVVTRIWILSFFYVMGSNSPIASYILNDPLHHYHFGLLLILMAAISRKSNFAINLAAIGLGIFLEEWAVFFMDIKLISNNIYLTSIDFIIIFSLVGLIYIVSKLFLLKLNSDK